MSLVLIAECSVRSNDQLSLALYLVIVSIVVQSNPIMCPVVRVWHGAQEQIIYVGRGSRVEAMTTVKY